MITPRRTRLVRVPDLPAFRRTVAAICREATAVPVVLAPTTGATRQLRATLVSAGVTGDGATAPVLVTRDGFYDLLHVRTPAAPRRLSALERDSLAQAAAHAAAEAVRGRPADPDADADVDADAGAAPQTLPFRLRPGLVGEMLRFYDQLRRQAHRLERFNELIEETLGGGTGDRGTERLLQQTRMLNETFRRYESLRAASGGWDEHTLREHVMREGVTPAVEHVVVTLADWIADPDGLFIGDFDLLARTPGILQLDLVCTESVLGSGFHERIHGWWPGLEEVDAASILGPQRSRRPRLEVPAGGDDRLWFTERDREEELAAVAQRVKAARRSGTGAPFERTAVVYKRPLPYLYLAGSTLGAAGLPFQSADALPLAGEPVVAAVDLVLETVESGFAREPLVALLGSPYLAEGAARLDRSAVRSLDALLRARGYLGEASSLDSLAAGPPAAGADADVHAALAVATAWATRLQPLREPAPASRQAERLLDFLEDAVKVPPADPRAGRAQSARDAVLALVRELASAHAAHHDPAWTIDDLAAAVRRAVETCTSPAEAGERGIHLLDDRAARYAELDDIAIVGLVDAEWPERQARNIFYPSGLLKALGWPSESTRRRAADARFLDLLGSASNRVTVSTVTLDDDAIVMRSMQLDEIPRARLSTVPVEPARARISLEDALAFEPPVLDPLEATAREWAALRLGRTAIDSPAYHGTTGPRPPRPWSVSALEAYLACPFKFFAQHVLRIDEEPEDSDVMDPRQQGQFVHAVFETFFERWGRAGGGTITPETLDAAREVFAAVVEERVATLPEAEAGLERTRLLGSSAAAGLGEAVLRMEAERPQRVVERLLEQRLDCDLHVTTDAGPRIIPLKGKADRIDLLEDGTFRLIDYKLGWPPQRSRALQLPIYALAAEQRLADHRGRSWTLGEAAYLAFKGPRRVVPLYSAPGDREKVMLDAQQRAAAVIDGIAQGEFPPRPDDVYLCETCSFAAVCRKDYVGDV